MKSLDSKLNYELIYKSLFNLFYKFSSAVCILFITYIVTNYSYDNSTSATFFIFLSFVYVASSVFRLGNDVLLIRIGAVKKHGVLVNLFRAKYSSLVTYLIFLIFFIFSYSIFVEMTTEKIISIISFLLSVIFFGFNILTSSYCNARGKFLLQTYFLNLGWSVVFAILLFMIISFKGHLTLNALSLSFLIANIVVFFTFLFSIKRYLLRLIKIRRKFFVYVFSLSLMLVSLSQQAMVWLSQLLSSYSLSDDEINFFAVAIRVSSLTTFLMVAVNSVIGRRFAILFNKRDFFTLKLYYIHSTVFVSAVSVTIVFVQLVFPETIFLFFNVSLGANTYLFYILVISQLVNLVSGPAILFLSMVNRDFQVFWIFCLTLTIIILLSSTLPHFFGLRGAILAPSSAIVIQNLLAIIFVMRFFKEHSVSH